MSTTLITGATGFIGSHVCRLLVERGDEVIAAVRESSDTTALARQDVQIRTADIRDRAAIRRAMKGVAKVFHVAGTTEPTASQERVFSVDVEGSRIVLEEALRAGVERVVLTSSAAAIGPAPAGTVADETNPWDGTRHRIPYLDAKHEVELIAGRIGRRGLPIVIVNPGRVLGGGDPARSSTKFVKRFLAREIPAYVDGTINIVGVEDVARGHLLADERGEHGERYILGNRNFMMSRLMADLGRLSGVEPPQVKLPLPLALTFARAGLQAPSMGFPSPMAVKVTSLRWAFSSAKAKRELRWITSPHEDALEATIAYYRSIDDDGALAEPGTRQPLVLRVAGELLRAVRLG
jgi:dihydroflavonol-4-reductase